MYVKVFTFGGISGHEKLIWEKKKIKIKTKLGVNKSLRSIYRDKNATWRNQFGIEYEV